jgi:secreted PhoX family phosphatase
MVRPAMGAFRHEAVAVDADRRQLFLTEDHPQGRLYRFVPTRWPDLSSGDLQAASVAKGVLNWVDVEPSGPDRSADTTAFDGGEGLVVSGSSLFVATKGDRRIWELDLDTRRLSVFHDCVARPDTPLTHVDNLALHPVTGHLFVAEDGGDMDLCMLVRATGGPEVTRVARFVGHNGSEVTGVAFSPDGDLLYLSSQRGVDGRGLTVQIRGPFVPWIERIDTGASPRRRADRLGNARRVGGMP